MAGTMAGGKKASATVKAKYGADHYAKIGKLSALNAYGPEYRQGGSKAKGFAAYPELASAAGIKGGESRRGKKFGKNKRSL